MSHSITANDMDVYVEQAGQGPDVLFIAGHGFSTIALARAYPAATVDGLDLDDASIADARRLAAEAGVSERARFIAGDASELARHPYDLILYSRRCMTSRTPSTRCAPHVPRSPAAARCSSSTSASPRRSPPPATTSSG